MKLKIIKRNIKDGEDTPQIPINTLKTESDSQRRLSNTVNDWIYERRKNSRAEKIFSDSKITAWKDIS